MKRTKSLLAALLAFVLALSSSVFAWAAPEAVPEDIAGYKYQTDIELLLAMGIVNGFEDGTFRPDATILRSEFTALVTRVLALDHMGGPVSFTDVPADHWAIDNIYIASQTGLVNGYPDGTFRPDANISFDEAVKIVVSGLGYEQYAMAAGGYPMGFLNIARTNDITDGLTFKGNSPITRGEVARLLANALDVDVMEQVGFGADLTYQVMEGKNILNSKLDMETGRGTITGNSYTSIADGGKLNKGEVSIDGQVMLAGDTDAESMVGLYVRWYARVDKNTDEMTLLYLLPAKKQTSVTINGEDVDEETTTTELVYWADGEKESLEIDFDANVMYNGKRYFGFTAEDLKPQIGTVELVDSNADGSYELVNVWSYDTYVVDSVNTKSLKIYDKAQKTPITLDSKADGFSYSIIKDGKNVELGELAEWDVLDVAVSRDGMVVTIRVSGDVVEGRVTEIDAQLGEYTIGDRTLRLAHDYDADRYGDIRINTQAGFYVDTFGYIAAMDASIAANNYAYLYKARETKGVDKNLELILFATDGSLETYSFASKVRLNGAGAEPFSQLYDEIRGIVMTGNAANNQLVKFKANADKQITEFTAAQDNTGGTVYDPDDFTLDVEVAGSSMRYYNRMFDGKYRVAQDTPVLLVPHPDDAAELGDSVMFVSDAKTEFKNGYTYNNFSMYDLDEDRTAAIVVKQVSRGEDVSMGQSAAVINSRSRAVDSEGNEVTVLYYWQDGKKSRVMVEDSPTVVGKAGSDLPAGMGYESVGLDDLVRGDVIQFATNYRGYLTSFRPLYVAAQTQPGTLVAGAGNGYDNFRELETAAGYIVRKGNDTITLDIGGTELLLTLDTAPAIYRYDKVKEEYEVLDIGDLNEYNSNNPSPQAFVHLNRKLVQAIVIADE